MSRIPFTAVWIGFVLLSCPIPSNGADPNAGKPAPNILLIFADDVGREVLGCYGGTSYQTPNIDRLARQGMKFHGFHAAPVCHASRIMLMTGNYPTRYRNPAWGTYPPAAEKTSIASRMKRLGYRTAIAGKWQLTLLKKDPLHPQRVGFDESCLFGWHEGPRYWAPLLWQNGKLRAGTESLYGPDEYVRFLTDFMNRKSTQPFFAVYSMALCHAVSDDFLPRPPHGPDGRYMTYAEMVADMDRHVGMIMDGLGKSNRAAETLILFVTDNGTTRSNFIRHEGKTLIREDPISSVIDGKSIPGAKTRFTDWGIRVPAIAVWPGKIKPQSENNSLIDLTDLLPTFVEIGSKQKSPPLRPPVDGKSFAGVLTGRSDRGPRTWVCVQNGKRSCIKDHRWKLISDGKLFDLKNDPMETQPLGAAADTPESSAARTRLRTILDQLNQPLNPVP